MITKERKAEIARENGAKSKGPLTDETKQKSARNAITHGERAQAFGANGKLTADAREKLTIP